jgi:hypothetical protein
VQAGPSSANDSWSGRAPGGGPGPGQGN